MKKIPCLFHRDFGVSPLVVPQLNVPEEVLLLGTPTRKWDGTAVAVLNGVLYARYDVKKGRVPPPGAIPCQDPDKVTGHWPHWVPADRPEDKWIRDAASFEPPDGTYEAVGPKIGGNPEHLKHHKLRRHGEDVLRVEPSFDAIREFLQHTPIEGLVYWLNGEPRAKIRRKDFGFRWPMVML